MSFSKVARVMAFLGLMFGILEIVMGFTLVSWGISGEALGRYTSAPTTGALIDRGCLIVLVAVALGTLAEIAIAVRKSGGQQTAAAASASRDPADR